MRDEPFTLDFGQQLGDRFTLDIDEERRPGARGWCGSCRKDVWGRLNRPDPRKVAEHLECEHCFAVVTPIREVH